MSNHTFCIGDMVIVRESGAPFDGKAGVVRAVMEDGKFWIRFDDGGGVVIESGSLEYTGR